MKRRAKEMGLDDIRVNNAGCLERCELGPTMVVYPEGHLVSLRKHQMISMKSSKNILCRVIQ